MQAWRRQPAQCIFCEFRQAAAIPQTAISYRRYNSTFRIVRESRRKRPSDSSSGVNEADIWHRKELGRKELFKVSREHPGPRNAQGKPLIRRTTDGPRRVDNKEAILVAIKQGLSTLERQLRQKNPAEDGSRSQMDLLDPGGKSWQAYCRYVETLGKRAQSTVYLSSSEKLLWDSISWTFTRNITGMDKELYFGFLDFSLKPLDTTQLHDDAMMPVDLRYPTEWYAAARKSQRVIHLHVGPTNSGKTYNALKRLQEAKNGFYAGPLRLLAHEVYSRFRANGIACDLVTGDDVRLDPSGDSHVYASTVEMVDCSRDADVAIIDEIQMMGSEERGWAWTRAFLGANAKEVHLCGEARVVPLIRELSASMGDTLHIHHYQRLNPLQCMSRSLRGNLKSLRKGDCIVTFSVVQIHALKQQIELDTGKRCAIVYGSLPPETRAAQADLFNDPDNDYDYLVASDAIGMGLNLSVKRIIFNSVRKWDGRQEVQLTIPQIKQIAGRAGRFRSAHQDKNKSATVASTGDEENVGLVTCLDEADLPIIRAALETEAPPLRKAGIIPPAEYLEEYSSQLPPGTPFEYLMRKVSHAATVHPRYFLCDVRDKLTLARITDEVANLTIEQRVHITAAPLGSHSRESQQAACLKALARAISKNNAVTVADVSEIPLEILSQEPKPDRSYLESLETLHKCLIMFLWLSYRFPTSLRDQPMAVHAKDLAEQKIDWVLRAFSANPRLRERLRKLREDQTTEDAASSSAVILPEESKASRPVEVSEDALHENEPLSKLPRSMNHQQPMMESETVEEHFAAPSTNPSSISTASAPKGSSLDIAGHEEEWEERPPADSADDQLATPDERVALKSEVLQDTDDEISQPRSRRQLANTEPTKAETPGNDAVQAKEEHDGQPKAAAGGS